jgi:16S rRNA (guanine1207-N2)-methyltransferase
MRRRTGNPPLSQREVPAAVAERVEGRVVVVLGSPAEVVNLLQSVPVENAVCWQLDLYQAGRVREELAEAGITATVTATPDLWDLPAEFDTAIYMAPKSGERELKIDMVEQGFHVLAPRGKLVIWSPYEGDLFFPNLLKKIFGKTHSKFTGAPGTKPGRGSDTVLWATRDGDRPRRRHEITFQSKILDRPSCRFLSRPGTFSYGRFDEGARALIEVAEIDPGSRVVDLGCGCGTNGVFAAQAAGREAFVGFVDSNVRAIALAELNAKSNGVEQYQAVPTATVEGLEENSFDVVLANPPYYASGSIANLFIDRGRALLTSQGSFYLVTRMPNEVVEAVERAFGRVEILVHRGYSILVA